MEAVKNAITVLFALAFLTQIAIVFTGDTDGRKGITFISGIIAGICILNMCIKLIA